MANHEKEYLYVGYYISTEKEFVLKIGTTCDLERRRKEHTRNYRKSPYHTMPPDEEFHYIWYIQLSKYNTLRYEDRNRQLWQEMGIGEFVRNDRFILCNIPNFVPVKIRKTYQIALAEGAIFCAFFLKKTLDNCGKVWYNWRPLNARAGPNFNYTTAHTFCQEKILTNLRQLFFPILYTLPIAFRVPLWYYNDVRGREEPTRLQVHWIKTQNSLLTDN